MSVKKALDEFGEYVRTQSQANLKKEGKNVSGNLYNSIDYFTKESKNSFQLDILMDDYGKFVDKGVKASATRARKALAELSKLIKARRKEIQEVKNAAKTAA